MTGLPVEWLVPCVMLALLVSCSVEDSQLHCKRSTDCASGEECYMGFCVLSDAGTHATSRSGVKIEPDTAMASEDGSAAASEADGDAAAESVECQASVGCYEGPAKTRGVGACRDGRRACVAGVLGACQGSRVPTPEACTNEGQDDDCNGVVDDIPRRGQACDAAASSAECGRGSLRCVDKQTALQCVVTRMDSADTAELCNGRDDDCDGKSDEGLNLQVDTAHCGSCNHACATGQSCRAGVCVAAAFSCSSGGACQRGASCCSSACVDLQADAKHCGACGHACQGAETCCGGRCVDMRSDLEHCGGCGVACAGQLPGCCAGECKDLSRDNENCGRCGAACGGALGGLLCSCRQEGGKARCEGDVFDVCL